MEQNSWYANIETSYLQKFLNFIKKKYLLKIFPKFEPFFQNFGKTICCHMPNLNRQHPDDIRNVPAQFHRNPRQSSKIIVFTYRRTDGCMDGCTDVRSYGRMYRSWLHYPFRLKPLRGKNLSDVNFLRKDCSLASIKMDI